MNTSTKAEQTYRYDILRAPFYGILEAGWSTFALVIAIRYFEAPDKYKSFIAGAWSMGFLLTPLTLYLVAKLRYRSSLACACMFGASAVLMVGATLAQSLLIFTLLIMLSQIATAQQGPLMLQIYSDNYTSKERGSRMTVPFILMALCTSLFAYFGGKLLDASINNYRILFAVITLAAVGAAWAVSRIPSKALTTEHIGNPWQSFSLIWKDKLFGYLLGSWMLLGFGNLITLPIRVEYLANPDYGVNASNTSIAFLVLIVPATARVLSTKLWGHFFDRLHLITTRNLLNVFFMLSIACFFFTTNLVLLTFAMALLGVAMGGGKIVWSLWVTKIAPDEKASSYMSIHMALTGFRGTLAPFIGYWILSQSAPKVVAIVGLVLIALSVVLFEFVRKHPRWGARPIEP
ncbi:MAG: MFS transporter [Opitutales bacterium]|jgi:MFS family permease|nr:MFS transporter [Opitutales bacterium]MDP4777478.1 MFS transporter [Opitutales bacterium]MDP4880248.1 MFS transporter [Opitutales bacterium]